MILLDTNIPLYAVDSSSPHHRAVRTWFQNVLDGDELVRFCWASLVGFVRICTNPRVYARPYPPAEAVAMAQAWLALPNLGVLEPGDDHLRVLAEVLAAGQARGAAVTDAHLAALAIEYGAVLASTDRGIHRFPGLRLVSPLD